MKRTNHKFTTKEDERLKKLVKEYGTSAWDEISMRMNGRNPRQCHDRWIYYLSPTINNSPWTKEEDDRLIKLCRDLNWKWVKVAKHFKGRHDTQIKNRWNVLKKERNLPDVPKRRSKQEQKIEPDSQVIQDMPTVDFTSLFGKLDSAFSLIDGTPGDFSTEFLF